MWYTNRRKKRARGNTPLKLKEYEYKNIKIVRTKSGNYNLSRTDTYGTYVVNIHKIQLWNLLKNPMHYINKNFRQPLDKYDHETIQNYKEFWWNLQLNLMLSK